MTDSSGLPSMKAIYYDSYGSSEVLQWGERPRPERRKHQVLVRVRASGLNPKDVLVRKGKFRLVDGGGFPRTPGYDFAGEVVDTPEDARFSIGEHVFGMVQAWSGGTSAQFVCCPVDELAPKPSSLSMEEAASIPLAAQTALQALRDCLLLSAGDHVLLNGASGGVGVYAIQIARILGARVTAVCSSRNRELVESLGANEVQPYDDPSFSLSQGAYDAYFEIFGNRSHRLARSALSRHGRYVTTIPTLASALRDVWSRWLPAPSRLVVVKSRRADLEQLARWIEEQRLRPVVDRVFPLEKTAEAHRHLETKRARGKIVLRVP